jgi:hypothetical protein
LLGYQEYIPIALSTNCGTVANLSLEDPRKENRDDRPIYPNKMACFFKDPDTNKTMALVQEVEFQTRAETLREPQLLNHWRLKSKDN